MNQYPQGLTIASFPSINPPHPFSKIKINTTMQFPTILLLIGTATALVPQTHPVDHIFKRGKICSQWAGFCPPTSVDIYCCPGLKCKNERVQGSKTATQDICRWN
ncbi:Phosphoenolpyruvate carboxykinase [ATP] [Venturia inaequalis]|nr:Phosphoenolpyruvate carboxykinase [ATP] [Venturia inaequalis]